MCWHGYRGRENQVRSLLDYVEVLMGKKDENTLDRDGAIEIKEKKHRET